ncbi:MAG TPA: NAD(P)H-dependent oxidoreductase subunit E [Firmicutes bacterium]|jgi:NADP-reducing hydrogenase subunit HndA|nr:NAD(P)H-dependent oxidoreductase subunit E [Bacillota bacterium]
MTEACCHGITDEKYQKLDEVINQYKGKPGGLIPVLHQAQLIFGYLPKEVQIKVAEGLDIPLSEVYGVVTFYTFFSQKPRGKHTIGVCLGTACYVKGAAEIVEALENSLGIKVGDTTDNGEFSLMVTRCIGACGLAPVLTVGEDVYGRLSPDKIPEIIKHYEKM